MNDLIPEGTTFRYIKLGPGSAWAARSIASGEIHFGHLEVPAELANAVDKDAIKAFQIELGRTPAKAADFAREIVAFCGEPETTVWITFHGGRMWWARAAKEIIWLGAGEGHGARMRRTLGPWRDTDLKGKPLVAAALSTRLTKVEAYRQTICGIEDEDYLRTRINGEQTATEVRALAAKASALDVIDDLIAALHWRDFETLIDLMLARGGWVRTSELGGTIKDVDLIAEQSVTGEVAAVQIKSEASQGVLDDYIARLGEQPDLDRLIFACHTARGAITSADRRRVTVWAGRSLSEAAFRNGLFDWLVARAG